MSKKEFNFEDFFHIIEDTILIKGIVQVSIYRYLSQVEVKIKDLDTFEVKHFVYSCKKIPEVLGIDFEKLLNEKGFKYFKKYFVYIITNPDILRKRACNKEIRFDIKLNPGRTKPPTYDFLVKTKKYIVNITSESYHVIETMKEFKNSEIFPFKEMLKGLPAIFQCKGNLVYKYMWGTITDEEKLLLIMDHPEFM